MGCDNSNLHRAKELKDDEFYTMLEDIELELDHYKGNFINKTIYCNCDDPKVSNFYKYFSDNFQEFHLKKLIATCYKGGTGRAIKAVKTEWGETITPLQGDGSFDSPECVELLQEADIVVTNPPFSIIRKLFDLLLTFKKKFIVVGPTAACQYKPLLNLMQTGELQCGINYIKNFIHRGQIKLVGAVWYANVPNDVQKKKMILTKEYYPIKYPKYDNLDAIEVSRSEDIPCDYEGLMGVPISYFKFHNPEQFEIIDLPDNLQINGKEMFVRILIRRKDKIENNETPLW